MKKQMNSMYENHQFQMNNMKRNYFFQMNNIKIQINSIHENVHQFQMNNI